MSVKCKGLGLSSLLHLARGRVWVNIVVYVLSHLPHLQDVIFRDAAYYPWVVGVPSEVRNFCSMASMNELS